MNAATLRSSRFQLIAAFACIYIIWGSTYLAIRFAIETMPPLLMAGVRFLIAGSLLGGWLAFRGQITRPTRAQWVSAAVLGVLFFLGGNGGVSWAETRVPSGLAALMIATIPVWIVLFEWVRGTRPSARVLTGVLAGFSGVALLVGTKGPEGRIDPVGATILIIAEIAWAYGTVISRRLQHPRSHLQSGAMQMLAGGAALCVVGLILGEGSQFHPGAFSTKSILAVVYLVLAGSIVAFSAYNWLLSASRPERVGTYAFVNPIVAVFLGWAFAGEAFGPNTLIAAAFILTGVVLIVSSRIRGPNGAAPAPPDTKLRQHPERAGSPGDAAAILEEGRVAHVGFVEDGRPYVIPLSYFYDRETPTRLYLHGSRSGRAMAALASGAPLCVEVTLVDGLVYSKTAFHHSMNYRSAVAFGTARPVTDAGEQRVLMEGLIGRYFEGRTAGRDYSSPTSGHLGVTQILEVTIEAMSAKARTGGPTGPRDSDPLAPGTSGVLERSAAEPRPNSASRIAK